MFVQIIEGTVADREALRAAFDRWVESEASQATGWLGTTAGVADDGTFIALVRFESADVARRNSDRPEQGRWWAETSKLFSGDVTFSDCDDAVVFGDGGSDDAGFVQVMQGRVTDVDRMRELNEQFDAAAGRDFRPDVIGGLMALSGGGQFCTAVYFTSEAAAREGEQKEPPAEMKSLMDEEQRLYDGDLRFIDLSDPWLSSPS